MAADSLFCTQIWSPWRHVKTVYSDSVLVQFRSQVPFSLRGRVREDPGNEVLRRYSEKRRTSTGSQTHISRKWTPFPLICYQASKFVLLTANSLIKNEAKSMRKNENIPLSVDVRVPFLCNPVLENLNAFCLEIIIKHFLVSTWIFLFLRLNFSKVWGVSCKSLEKLLTYHYVAKLIFTSLLVCNSILIWIIIVIKKDHFKC